MKSQRYLQWRSYLSLTTCMMCRELHGKIYPVGEPPDLRPPLHPRCECRIEFIQAVAAGEATKNGTDGADWWLKYKGTLPDYYITKKDAEKLGWDRKKGNLDEIAPGKMIFGGIYRNDDGHLPDAPGRIWYEADINYKWGHRNRSRLLFSNDGLMFVTYDHYGTFQEIV